MQTFRIFNKCLGVVVLIAYLYFLLHLKEHFPNLVAARESISGDAAAGAGTVIAIPFLGIACLLLPVNIIKKLSPRYGPFQKQLSIEVPIYLLGYFLLILGYGVYQLFN